MINAEAQERIDTLMADTVLLTMQNNDVDTKRIKIAQAIFRAEQNLSDAMKGKLVFDREAAVMGELVINASGLKTEAEIKEAEAIMRKTQAQVDAINKGNEVISVNSKITGSLQQMTNAMRRMSEGTMNTKQALGAFLRIAAQLMAISDPTGGALLSVGAGFFAHTGGLVRNNGIQRFAQGGVVQGQDNVPIMAQAGEFVMRREAVQNIGVQNLAQMNRTGDAGGVTVNISAPLVDETVIDHIIPAINKATNRNLA